MLQTCDLQMECATLCELSKAGTQGNQLVAGDVGGHSHHLLAVAREHRNQHVGSAPRQQHQCIPNVVDTLPLKAEAVWFIFAVKQKLRVLAEAVKQHSEAKRER